MSLIKWIYKHKWGKKFLFIFLGKRKDKKFVLLDTIEESLEMAFGKSVIDGGMREGIVFRSQDGSRSFKAVSNDFLLKYHE